MTQAGDDREPLQGAIANALDLIRRNGSVMDGSVTTTAPLGSLLDQCRALHRASTEDRADPIRLVHHFACSGGTIISKCLAAMPNAVLLSEIDPLSTIPMGYPNRFCPTDLIEQLHRTRHPCPDRLVIDMFLASLDVLYQNTIRSGGYLVLREHSHSRFCENLDWTDRPTVREMIADRFAVRSAITIRHPMASYTSLQANNWVRFTPSTLEEYARRYTAFLDRHAGCPTLRYEAFVADPEAAMKMLCGLLDLPYAPGSPTLAPTISMSGDSGRSGATIAPRPNREISEKLGEEMKASPTYRALCDRLDYDPDFR
ncbi:sulfotransferase [Sulfitobacter sabulilitoris]|uniref:Sulfotransferase n=1 Tax=Sulfitobacter sabulilitoris TaxID=2562655 RepID=A0A5S3P7L0_9RHOB|nr:sulfotransferase [Sulfitobacter sabulilitoris]TMM49378.1 sulfotransferase [Sulfitobacter sabulilitoris]